MKLDEVNVCRLSSLGLAYVAMVLVAPCLCPLPQRCRGLGGCQFVQLKMQMYGGVQQHRVNTWVSCSEYLRVRGQAPQCHHRLHTAAAPSAILATSSQSCPNTLSFSCFLQTSLSGCVCFAKGLPSCSPRRATGFRNRARHPTSMLGRDAVQRSPS